MPLSAHNSLLPVSHLVIGRDVTHISIAFVLYIYTLLYKRNKSYVAKKTQRNCVTHISFTLDGGTFSFNQTQPCYRINTYLSWLVALFVNLFLKRKAYFLLKISNCYCYKNKSISRQYFVQFFKRIILYKKYYLNTSFRIK